ncbi:threonine/serine dehydratase [Bradyrhizobium sp. ARR65]|uniref:threonine/serine dehydratase n=1 Tax=Bradyrhizobium sp. ARR65 TaxID=1040989 RepID=UPI000465C3D7|nr:threonine/serine dehydratase [Bradyrhizobium sp. ARR65]
MTSTRETPIRQAAAEPLDRKRISEVERVIRPYVRMTPVLTADLADFELGSGPLHFKLEFLQHAGSFKTRGAFANLLSRNVPSTGVVAASGGNHGAAVAYAARSLRVRAKIFVPSVASPAKLARIRAYGADLSVVGERYADALAASQAWAAQSSAMAIHAFDQAETMLGQGTIGLELEAQVPQLDILLVSVGGGGLIGGIAAWYAGRAAVIGVEPESAPTLTYALRAGAPVDAPAGGIAADSLAPRRVGERVFPIARRHVRSVILVSDEAIREAQRRLWEILRVAIEPGGAAAAAAVLCGAYRPRPGEQLGVVLSGANTDAVAFAA